MYKVSFYRDGTLEYEETYHIKDGGHVLARQAAGRWEAQGNGRTASIKRS